MEKIKHIKILVIKGVPVYLHWTSILIILIILFAGRTYPPTIVGGISVFILILFHEFGHYLVASRLSLHTNFICIYPLLGICNYIPSYNNYYNILVSWGGITIQLLIAIPCLILYFTLSENINAILNSVITISGPYNLFIIFLNLIPFPGLDGYTCWKIFSSKIKEKKLNKKEKNLKKNHRNFKIVQ